jgi:hypothetical protein
LQNHFIAGLQKRAKGISCRSEKRLFQRSYCKHLPLSAYDHSVDVVFARGLVRAVRLAMCPI